MMTCTDILTTNVLQARTISACPSIFNQINICPQILWKKNDRICIQIPQWLVQITWDMIFRSETMHSLLVPTTPILNEPRFWPIYLCNNDYQYFPILDASPYLNTNIFFIMTVCSVNHYNDKFKGIAFVEINYCFNKVRFV